VVNATLEATRAERAWAVLDAVPDPEVPAISVRELGIVREVLDHGASMASHTLRSMTSVAGQPL
jgi:metal-sulfur cluster biosynthetic enzyme